MAVLLREFERYDEIALLNKVIVFEVDFDLSAIEVCDKRFVENFKLLNATDIFNPQFNKVIFILLILVHDSLLVIFTVQVDHDLTLDLMIIILCAFHGLKFVCILTKSVRVLRKIDL